ncbi:MAG: hypothetical protein NC485_13410 [Ruminococcus flavefaciens]|nr:hypothetical protein [Ruminococcus flavefaciens]MCM1061671.1 hypothetical protein [Eubacterium sp.]
MKKIPRSDKEQQKQLLHYVYEIEAPEEYVDILRKIADAEHMTVEEMIVQGLMHIAAHPEDLRKWETELNTLPDEMKADLSRIHVRSIKPVYSDELWLAKHTGGRS